MSFLVLPMTVFFSHISAISASTVHFSNLKHYSLFFSARTGVKEDPVPSKTDDRLLTMNPLPLFHNPLCKINMSQHGTVIWKCHKRSISAKKWMVTLAELSKQTMNL